MPASRSTPEAVSKLPPPKHPLLVASCSNDANALKPLVQSFRATPEQVEWMVAEVRRVRELKKEIPSLGYIAYLPWDSEAVQEISESVEVFEAPTQHKRRELGQKPEGSLLVWLDDVLGMRENTDPRGIAVDAGQSPGEQLRRIDVGLDFRLIVWPGSVGIEVDDETSLGMIRTHEGIPYAQLLLMRYRLSPEQRLRETARELLREDADELLEWVARGGRLEGESDEVPAVDVLGQLDWTEIEAALEAQTNLYRQSALHRLLLLRAPAERVASTFERLAAGSGGLALDILEHGVVAGTTVRSVLPHLNQQSLAPLLNDPDSEVRTKALMWIHRLGGAVPPKTERRTGGRRAR
jgi:hypothetical protein